MLDAVLFLLSVKVSTITAILSGPKPSYLISSKFSPVFIDDLSRGQHFGPSYVELYDDVIQELDKLGINYELFKNNWLEIKERHL